jgi:hypothetical protein
MGTILACRPPEEKSPSCRRADFHRPRSLLTSASNSSTRLCSASRSSRNSRHGTIVRSRNWQNPAKATEFRKLGAVLRTPPTHCNDPQTNSRRFDVRTVAAKSQYQPLALVSIHESATNPRRSFDELKLAELAESLRTQGLIRPSRSGPTMTVTRSSPVRGAFVRRSLPRSKKYPRESYNSLMNRPLNGSWWSYL